MVLETGYTVTSCPVRCDIFQREYREVTSYAYYGEGDLVLLREPLARSAPSALYTPKTPTMMVRDVIEPKAIDLNKN